MREKNMLCFTLYIPLSKKMGDQCLLKYESYERARPLLEKFTRLGLATDLRSSIDDFHDDEKKNGNINYITSEEKPLNANDEARLEIE